MSLCRKMTLLLLYLNKIDSDGGLSSVRPFFCWTCVNFPKNQTNRWISDHDGKQKVKQFVCIKQSSQCFPQIWILFVRWVGWLSMLLYNQQTVDRIGSKESIQVQGKIVSLKMSLVRERIQKGSRPDELGSNQMWIVSGPDAFQIHSTMQVHANLNLVNGSVAEPLVDLGWVLSGVTFLSRGTVLVCGIVAQGLYC